MAKSVAMVLVVMLIGVGCSDSKKDKQGVSRLSQKERDALAAENSKFEAAEDPPISAETYFAAGQLAESQDQIPRAIEQYKSALKVKPGYLEAMFRLGTLYTQVKMFPDAIDTWQKYVRATNGSATAYSNLGFCYELAKKTKDAEEAYRKGVAKDPKDQACRVNFGLMLARQGRIAEASEQFSAVLKPAEVHYNLGSVFEQQGKKDKARAEYQKALLLDAGLYDARKRLEALEGGGVAPRR